MTPAIIGTRTSRIPGGRPISTRQRGAASPAPARRPLWFAGLLLAVCAAGVVVAGPAAAIDDTAHPDARVTHGPSCRPGGLVVEVVAGTVPYAVRLTTTRSPDAEDEALLQPGQVVELRTGDVAPGETIDARLEYAAQDGSGTTFVDDLADWTLTRPTAEDCAAATAPPPSPTAEPTPDPARLPEPTTPSQQPPGPPPSSPPPATTAPSSPVPSATPSPPPRPSSTPPAPGPPRSTAAPATSGTAVSAGSTVRIRVEGYRPGERVTIALRGSDEVLGSATAGDDGSVTAEVRIPARTETGPAALHVVGGDPGAVAAVPLQVASAVTDAGPGQASSLPLLLAAGALSATGAALVSATTRRRHRR